MDKAKWEAITAWAHGHDSFDGGVPYDVFYDLYSAYCDDQKRVRVGVAVILPRYDGRILMGKRKGGRGAGTWHLIGGHMEHGETVEMCAIRETLEETGIQISTVYTTRYIDNLFVEDGTHYVTLYTMASIDNYPQPVLREPDKCEEWRWVDPRDMPMPLFPPLERYLRRYQILER